MALSARTAAFGAVTVLIALVGIELAVRIAFSVVTGESKLGYGMGSLEAEQKPGMLFPKRTHAARWHTVLKADDREKEFLTHATGTYSKYRTHQYKRNRDEYGHLSDIRINNLGFRGADVAVEKQPGRFRVIALGASSTFGYRNRDNETYPHYLEQTLNQRLLALRRSDAGSCNHVRSFEVLNLGIPHLDTANIHSLLVAEGLDLDPDLVTFYEGANETRLIEASAVQRGLSTVGDRLLAARFVHSMLQSYLSSFDAGELEHHAKGLSENFIARLSAIADATASHDVFFLVASQQAKSFLVPKAEMKQTRYAEEVRLVRDKLSREGRIALKEMIFLMHAELMHDLRRWAKGREAEHQGQFGFVDVIEAVDASGKRGGLLSWVHLSAEANRLVASVLADPIFERACNSVDQAH